MCLWITRGKDYEIQKIPNIDNIVNPSSKPIVSIIVPETKM